MSTQPKEQEPNPNGNFNNTESDHQEKPEQEQEEEEKEEQQQQQEATRQSSTRTPFTNLSQVDADLALARTLQEQERAYMMLRMSNDGSDYGSWEAASYLHDDDDDDFGDPHDHDDTDDDDDVEDEDEDEDAGENDGTDADDDDVDAFDVHAHAENGEDENNPILEFDPAVYSSDEAYARALQDAEEREMAARLLALTGISDRAIVTLDLEDHGSHSQDTWEDVDPDELSYEELLALGEVVGTESRGLSADSIANLPSVIYKMGSSQTGSNDSCVICRVDYEDGDSLTVLSCKHSYHPECINNWLKINKVCPVCSAEVSTSGQS
ncbi:hypothetical protein PTKIN_Ptkin10aG0086100 [Pterospermum kingtungense]